MTRQVEYHHLLVKARKFHKAVTDIEHYELETAAKNRGGGKSSTSLLMTRTSNTPHRLQNHKCYYR